MLAWCLGVLGLSRRAASASTVRAFSASTADAPEYRKLAEPVVLPLEDVARPWHPAPFDALVPAGDTGAGPNVSLKGVLLRVPTSEEATRSRQATRLEAFCLTCPHEICQVEFLEDTTTVRVDAAARPDHPLLVCPCHFSVFNPTADGARITGPASRGLFRFRFEIGPERVTITEVEDEVLRLFSP